MKNIHFPMGIAVLLCISFAGYAQTFTLVKDINPGGGTSSPASLTNIDGQLWFSADDGTNGREIWRTNGTEPGTALFIDINPGAAGSNPAGFTKVNDITFFIANDGVTGPELWKSDGTIAGTTLVKDINPGAAGSGIGGMVNINGTLFFTATNGIDGSELWKSDGTLAGTVMVKDIRTSPAGASSGPSAFAIANNILFFAAFDNSGNTGIWKTDGTEAGTTLVSYAFIGQMVSINNTILFSSPSGFPTSLWKTDGTAAGTVLVKSAAGMISGINNVNGTAFYTSVGSPANTIRVWKSDGTTAGTVEVKQIVPPPSFSIGPWSSVNGFYFFNAPVSSASGAELWKSDGTEAGTVLVKDIFPGTITSSIVNPAPVNNILYFSANDGVSGNEIWKTDGTEAGTVLVQNINTTGNANPAGFTRVGFKLYVTVIDDTHNRELWVADLSTPGPLPLTLLNVSAKLVGQNGVVSWKTTFEENTSHFEIERSANNRQYTKVGTVASANTGATHDYSFVDPQITALGVPVVFYRLKMKDLDSKSTYSKTFAIDISSDQPVVMLYPTPVHESATVMIAVKRKENITLSVVDMTGKVVQQKRVVVNDGSNMISIETGSLSAGVYTVMINGENTNTSTRLIKQ